MDAAPRRVRDETSGIPAKASADSRQLTSDEIVELAHTDGSAPVSPARAALDRMMAIADESGLYEATAEPKRTR